MILNNKEKKLVSEMYLSLRVKSYERCYLCAEKISQEFSKELVEIIFFDFFDIIFDELTQNDLKEAFLLIDIVEFTIKHSSNIIKKLEKLLCFISEEKIKNKLNLILINEKIKDF